MSSLPEGWVEKNLVSCLEKVIDYRGKTPKKSGDGILTLSAKSVKMGTIDYSKAYYIPHHVIQRGVRRIDVFQNDDDYNCYLDLISKSCKKTGTEVWAYCLMTNHVHLILVPSVEDGLRASLAGAHRQYTRHINFREGCRGHLWQERFHSFAMDEHYLHAAVRYVELNPVHANMVKSAEDYPWSSARAHLAGKDDKLVKVAPMLERISDWRTYLDSDLGDATKEEFRKHGRTGRPIGNEDFLTKIENSLGRTLRPQKPGPKKSIDR